jgi:hypothetical protein
MGELARDETYAADIGGIAFDLRQGDDVLDPSDEL